MIITFNGQGLNIVFLNGTWWRCHRRQLLPAESLHEWWCDGRMAVDYWTNWLNGVGIIEDDAVENGELSLSLSSYRFSCVSLCVVNFSSSEMECEKVTTQNSRLCSLLYISRYIHFPLAIKTKFSYKKANILTTTIIVVCSVFINMTRVLKIRTQRVLIFLLLSFVEKRTNL